MAGMDEEEWVAHLGAGLILCCFGKYEQALGSLVRCHQLALRSESQSQGDRCRVDVAARALCEAVGSIQQGRGSPASYKLMTTRFLRYNSARAWSAFFVGWALLVAKRESKSSTSTPEDPVRWLKRSLNLAAGSTDINLSYIECSANRLLYDITPKGDWQTQLHHLKMWKEAAARWGKLDEEVWAVYEYEIVCFSNNQHSESVQSRERLNELVTNQSDIDFLLQAMYECCCSRTAYKIGGYELCLDYCMKVMSRLRAAPLLSTWSSYFGYCATPGFHFKSTPSSPTRDERLFWCLENAVRGILLLISDKVRESDIAIALDAISEYERLLNSFGGFFYVTQEMKLVHLCILCHIYTSFSELNGEDWPARAESALAETLQLSHTRRAWRAYIETLRSVVRLADILKGDNCFYFQREDPAENAHYEMIDSFQTEAERLARQHEASYLSGLLSRRALHLFRMQMMDRVIEILEPLGKELLEESYKLGCFSTDRIMYSEWESGNFEMLQAALISCHHPDRALLWAERERAQDLLYNLQLNENVEKFEEIMEFNLDDAKALEVIKSITRDAGEDTAFLIYTTVWGSQGLCGFLLHQTVTRACFTKFEAELNITTQVQQITQNFHHNCKEFDQLRLKRLREWYKLLILPFQIQLDHIKPRKLVIIPGKHLAGLPFAALHEGPGEPFLIERYAISCVPSLRMYSHCKQRGEALMQSSKRMSAVVIGNPTTDLADHLPYAGKEAQSTKIVLQEAGFQRVDLLHDDQATKSAILENLATSDWVHYAGHAVVSSNFPHGALLLAKEKSPVSTVPADGDDQVTYPTSGGNSECSSAHSKPDTEDSSLGMRLLRYAQARPSSEVLTGDDIESCGVKMQALVTVLSACQSGLGEVLSEGVLGLYRALHVAGAPSVLCSLWNLDDEFGMSFMGILYERLYSHREELAIALQEVMVDMINEGEPIEKWAAYIISGSPSMKLIESSLS